MFDRVTPSIRLAALDFACDTQPDAADPCLPRCGKAPTIPGLAILIGAALA
jgi:hypothetical protein